MNETSTKKEWFYRYLTNVSLHKLNNLSIIFILVFTILFSVLLIHDEYLEFETMLAEQKTEYLARQERSIMTASRQFERLFDYTVLQHPQIEPAELERLAALAVSEAEQFIVVYDAQMRALTGKTTVRGAAALRGAEGPLDGIVVRDGRDEPVLLYRQELANGYMTLSGIYLRPFEERLEEQFRVMKARLIRIILEIVTLSFILFGFILGVSQVVNSMLEHDVDSFLEFFEKATQKYHTIRYVNLFFKEFKTMGKHANTMVHTIIEQKMRLEQLNLTLEDKVRTKTAKLQKQNEALEKEKEFSQHLLDSQKQFVRYAIHETNTPLSVIVTNIELYTMKHGKDRYLSKVEAAVKNIFNIYDDLSYLVKKDQIDYPSQRIDLCEYLQGRVEFFDEVAQFAGVSFVYGCNTERASIEINETKLQRIVDNNLTNAIKYTRVGEEIMVQITETEGEVLFSVASQSTRIADIKKIFEPYYREGQKSDGFGLGLNLVKSICDEEGIAIEIATSEEETCFSYRFRSAA